MKQIAKSDGIKEQLRAAFGADANLDALAVYEAIALNTRPLRKAGGIYRGARPTLSLLAELANWIGKESVPLQVQHDTSTLPFGRVFKAEMVDDELRVLFALDGVNHGDVVTKLDTGVLDQVSVGFFPKSLKCSKCAFDYMAANAEMNLWRLECSEGHKIGEDGTFVFVDGLDLFFELSLVGMGAANGAKIVGRSDARLQSPDFQQRLAASVTDGRPGVLLTATPKDSDDMNAEQMAQFSAAVTGKATAEANLATVTAARDALQAQVTQLTEQVATLTAAGSDVAAANTARDAAVADLQAAVAALQAEATTILTACGKPVPEQLPTSVADLTALIAEHRAQFAGVIPVGGAAAGADTTVKAAAVPASAAFRTAR